MTNILKITAGSTPEIADYVDAVYQLIIEAGTHKAPSIKVAGAAKLIDEIEQKTKRCEHHDVFKITDAK